MISAQEHPKASHALRNIREAAEILELPQHVLRYWETQFPQLDPMKRQGGRRFYRPEDIVLLTRIKTLLHERGFTIKGAVAHLHQHPEEDSGDLAGKLEDGAAPAADLRAPFPMRERLAALRGELAEIQHMLEA